MPSATDGNGDGYTYLGCFADAEDRALDGEQYRPSGTLTVESCYEFCNDLGYEYFGVQYPKQVRDTYILLMIQSGND